MRSFAAVLLVSIPGTSFAEPETPLVIDDAAREENRERLDALERRADEERRDRILAKREAERTAELDKVTAAEYEHARAVRAGKRGTGYKYLVTAGVFGTIAGVAGYLGKGVNDDVGSGQFATVDELQNLEDKGTILNYVAYGALGFSGLTALIGTAYVLLNLDPGNYEVVPLTGGARGVSFSGRF